MSKPRIQVQLKLRLTCAQEAQFRRWLWHMTGLYNWTLRTIELEAASGRYPTVNDLWARVNGHSQRLGVPVDVLRGVIHTAHTAWARAFRGVSRKPKLKGRRRPMNSLPFGQGVRRWHGSRPVLTGTGPLRVHRQDVPAGHCGYARIVKRASGWYLCLFIQTAPRPIQRVADGEVGIDPGFSSLLTLSTGEAIPHPRELERGALRLAQAQRGQRKRLTARLHERTRNQRRNRNHHLSRRLVSENRLIAFSADPHAKVARRFGRSVTSSGHNELRSQLRYKSLLGGAEYIEVPSRNSTRACSNCGGLTGPTGLAGLKVRHWDCGACGAHHDRDVNAATNTLNAALGMSVKGGREAASGIAR